MANYGRYGPMSKTRKEVIRKEAFGLLDRDHDRSYPLTLGASKADINARTYQLLDDTAETLNRLNLSSPDDIHCFVRMLVTYASHVRQTPKEWDEARKALALHHVSLLVKVDEHRYALMNPATGEINPDPTRPGEPYLVSVDKDPESDVPTLPGLLAAVKGGDASENAIAIWDPDRSGWVIHTENSEHEVPGGPASNYATVVDEALTLLLREHTAKP